MASVLQSEGVARPYPAATEPPIESEPVAESVLRGTIAPAQGWASIGVLDSEGVRRRLSLILRSRLYRSIPSLALAAMFSFVVATPVEAQPGPARTKQSKPASTATAKKTPAKAQVKPKTTTRTSART